ncbi:MAG: GNAT family N-acetyltransferase [Hyphomicrobium sp.]|nr:GNAT family N-acetyltransferase [Hyphomicrobium sp.]
MTASAAVNLRTPTGFRLSVRPAGPEDDAALTDFFENVSEDDLRFRVPSSIHTDAGEQIAAMTHADHRQTEDFMIFSGGGDHVIANVMLAADPKLQTAEVAITVHNEFKDQGIEQTVLEFVATNAKARGIKKLQSIESRDNHDSIEVERALGFTAHGVEGDPMLVLMEQRL